MWPGDVINDVMNMYLHKCSHNLTIPMHRKFCDDIFACFLVIMKNVVISFIKEYRGPTLRPPCDVIDDVIIMKILLAKFGTIFSYLRSDWSCVKYFKIFKMAAILSSRQTFYWKLYRKLNIPERWPCAFPTFWAFDWCSSSNIDGDISISKFDQFCDLVTSSMMSWVRET